MGIVQVGTMPEYSIELAKSGRATCKKCKSKIDKDTLRIGVHTDHPEWGITVKWEHCCCHKLNLDDASELTGWDLLTSEQQSQAMEELAARGSKRPAPSQPIIRK